MPNKTVNSDDSVTPHVIVQSDAVGGAQDDAAYAGSGDASVISLLKAIYDQNETMIAHLAQIETNTTPAP